MLGNVWGRERLLQRLFFHRWEVKIYWYIVIKTHFYIRKPILCEGFNVPQKFFIGQFYVFNKWYRIVMNCVLIYSSTYHQLSPSLFFAEAMAACPQEPSFGENHPQELLCDACARLEVAESSDDRELPQAHGTLHPQKGILAHRRWGSQLRVKSPNISPPFWGNIFCFVFFSKHRRSKSKWSHCLNGKTSYQLILLWGPYLWSRAKQPGGPRFGNLQHNLLEYFQPDSISTTFLFNLMAPTIKKVLLDVKLTMD